MAVLTVVLTVVFGVVFVKADSVASWVDLVDSHLVDSHWVDS